jgi:hypothetical protein
MSTTSLTSVGPITFSPGGILFVADNVTARITAFDLSGDTTAVNGSYNIEQLDTRLASWLGCPREDVFIRDLAVHPKSGRLYLSVMRGAGASGVPVIATVSPDGQFAEVRLADVRSTETSLSDAPAPEDARIDHRLVQGTREGQWFDVPQLNTKLRVASDPIRTMTVTDLQYVDGVLLVAGASNEEFVSTLRRIPYPFNGAAARSSLEIFHVSHRKYETHSPIRSLLPYGGDSVLAAYTCTPVVHFPLRDLVGGAKVQGRTVAELGAGNTPLDMVSFVRDGEEYVLVSNVRHPLMKIRKSDIDRQPALTEPAEPVGVPREHLPQKGVSRMANVNGGAILMLQMDEAEHYHLRSYATAAL